MTTHFAEVGVYCIILKIKVLIYIFQEDNEAVSNLEQPLRPRIQPPLLSNGVIKTSPDKVYAIDWDY